MKKILLIVMLISSFTLGTGTTACNKEEQKTCLHTTIETEGLWKGLKKTDMGTYIPESYEQVYERLKNNEYYKENEEFLGYQQVFNKEEYVALLNEKRKIVPQSYPKDAIVSPYHFYADSYDYVNAIIFIPEMTLDETENKNLGLTQIQYDVLEKDMLYYQRRAKRENLTKPNEIEVMDITCSIDEMPSSVQTLSSKVNNMLEFEFLPSVTNKSNTLNIGYQWGAISNNSQYLYVLTKDGGCISFDGKYDKNGGFQEHVNTVEKSQVERIIYLYFHPDNDKGAYHYIAKIIVFNLN